MEQNCSICFESFKNPSLTSCGHIFCNECLNCVLNSKICPICKSDLAGKEIYL